MLYGRDTELSEARTLTDLARDGRGGTLLIEGEPGIGKSALLAAIADHATHVGMTVLRGTAEENSQEVPFAGIRTCWASTDPDAAEIVRLLHDGEGETAHARSLNAGYREFAAAEALLAIVERRCTQGPVALFLDDLQWTDTASLLIVDRLVRMCHQLPVLIALARRPVPNRDALVQLQRGMRSQEALRLRLGPLTERAVVDLVDDIVGARPDAGLLTLVAGAGGNPLYVNELLKALNAGGGIEIVDGVATASGVPAPPSLTATIQSRLGFLSKSTRDMLRVAALTGSRFDGSNLSTILGTPILKLIPSIREALQAEVLTIDGQHLAFRHELIRRALHDELTPPQRAAFHSQAGKALAATGAPVDQVAQHLVAADALDRASVSWLGTAADSLIVQTPARAVEVLRRALAELDHHDPERNVVELKLARALLYAGLPGDARQVAQSALAATDDPARQVTLRWILAQSCFRAGELDQAVEETEEALEKTAMDADAAARFHGFAAQCLLLRGRPDRAETSADKAVRGSDAYARAYAQNVLASIRSWQERPAEALQLADQAIVGVSHLGLRPDLQMAPHLARGRALMHLDRLPEAAEAFEAGMRLDEASSGTFIAVFHMAKTLVRFWDGNWDEALVAARAGSDAVDHLGLTQSLQGLAALIAAHRGDPQAAAGLVEQRKANLGGDYYELFRVWTNALMLEARGKADDAVALLFDLWQGAATGTTRVDRFWLSPDIARLAATTGNTVPTKSILDAATRMAQQYGTPCHRATAAFCHGLLDGDAEVLISAATDYRSAHRPLFEGYAHESAADLLAKSGDAQRARFHLEAARTLYGNLNAVWDTARAEARLRDSGIRLGFRGRRGRPQSGWAALTDTEARVAELVGHGYSNPDIAAQLFLSRRTVQTHVARIFTKLSVSTRVALAVAVSARKTQQERQET